jgi:hypothetical protein
VATKRRHHRTPRHIARDPEGVPVGTTDTRNDRIAMTFGNRFAVCARAAFNRG